jgi:predicted transcriptional regulator
MLFGFGSKKRVKQLEEDVKNSFKDVKKDFEHVGKWIKHLHGKHDSVEDILNSLKIELSTIRNEFDELKEHVGIREIEREHKQVFKKQTAVDKQTGVYGVEKDVQTPVQTGVFYGILNGLSSNERMILFTLMNSDMKLSYEDVARLLGKERSTIRGQINAIKRKSEGLIQEMQESNGKKRIYVSEEVKEKLAKYAKVRVKEKKKYKKLPKDA